MSQSFPVPNDDEDVNVSDCFDTRACLRD